MLSPAPNVTYFPTVMARYSLFVLKVSLNPNKTPHLSFTYFTSQFIMIVKIAHSYNSLVC